MGVAAGDPVRAVDQTTQDSYSSTRPICRLLQISAQTGLASGATTAMTFTSEDVDFAGFHDNVTNNSRITPNVAGWYEITGSVSWTGQTDYTFLQAFVRLNGSTGIPPAGRFAGNTTSGTLVIPTGVVWVLMNGSTDYVELCGVHTRSGAGTSSTVISVQFQTVFTAQFLRPA